VAALPRIAVVGLGSWGKNHALCYADYDGCELALVCDADPDRAEATGRELGVPWTMDTGQVAGSAADGVSIATPDHLHTAVTLQMIEAGKAVFVEKPLATSVEEAGLLAAAASRSGRIAMVDFQNRWNPAFMSIKDAVAKGEIGGPVMGYVRLSDSITVAESWLSWAGQSGPECGIDCWDAIQALVQFEDCFVTFETSWVVPAGSPSVVDSRFTLYGDKGKVDYDWTYSGLAFVRERTEYPWIPVGARDRYGHLTHFVYEPMRHFADCLADKAVPETSFADGLENVMVIDAIRRSLTEQRPVAVER
jgi:predicted dehydrogenase